MSRVETVTGREPVSGDDAFDALIAFYKAFNNGDLKLMADNWLHEKDASLANPLGGLRRGWDEIWPLYENLFNGPARVYVEFYDYTLHQRPGLFLAVGRERGWFRQDDTEISLAIRTSRTYVQTVVGWKQLHHHGSIEDPALLQRYQQAVFGN